MAFFNVNRITLSKLAIKSPRQKVLLWRGGFLTHLPCWFEETGYWLLSWRFGAKLCLFGGNQAGSVIGGLSS